MAQVYIGGNEEGVEILCYAYFLKYFQENIQESFNE